ncbi:MAG: amidohydrolase [Chloroflexi bacterium]|nr:amidohydrolase [Chloroflexota bacterium]
MRNTFHFFAVITILAILISGCQPAPAPTSPPPTSTPPPPPTHTIEIKPTETAIPHETADIVLTNGVIYTVDNARSVYSAMAVKGDTIVYVGDDQGASEWVGDQTRLIDLQGKLVLPGLIDAHNHANFAVSEVFEVPLWGIQTVDGYKQAISEFLAAHPGLQGLKGGGWINPLFPPEGPSKEILDELAPDIPVVLGSEDYHSVWVNSKALEMAGITKDTPNPAGGIIERDAEGNPNGTLRESAADLVSETIPAYTADQVMEGLKYFQDMAHSFGITTVHVPHLTIGTPDLEAFRQLENLNEMTIRFRGALGVEPTDDPSIVEQFVDAREQNKGGLFEISAAKIFMDGVVEGSTAYLEEPYVHKPDSRGELLWDPEKYNAICAALEKAGFQIHVHSIGDAATRITLDGFAFAHEQNGAGDRRHMVTHLQLVNPEDILRFAELNVVAVPQPYWFIVDSYYTQAVEYLGQERADQQYPMKSFFTNDVVVASASDYNVTVPPNPLAAIEAGVTRKWNEGITAIDTDTSKALNPSEAVTLEEMIASFTINGAYANFLENVTGSLEVGKKADFIILDKNIFEIPVEEIHTAAVLLTFFEGAEVYRSEAYLE